MIKISESGSNAILVAALNTQPSHTLWRAFTPRIVQRRPSSPRLGDPHRKPFLLKTDFCFVTMSSPEMPKTLAPALKTAISCISSIEQFLPLQLF